MPQVLYLDRGHDNIRLGLCNLNRNVENLTRPFSSSKIETHLRSFHPLGFLHCFNPPIGTKVFTSVAAIVSVAPRTINQSLLRDTDQITFAVVQEKCTFDGTTRTKRPTWSAYRLIFYWCDLERENMFSLNYNKQWKSALTAPYRRQSYSSGKSANTDRVNSCGNGSPPL